MSPQTKPTKLILITPGDPAGIGPEIVAKTFRAKRAGKSFLARFPGFRFLCVGAREPFEKLRIPLFDVTESDLDHAERFPVHKLAILSAPQKNESTPLLAGFQAGWSIEKAARMIQGGKASALVTGPISKERLQQGGYHYSGHTDFLADLCGTKQVTMMLANEQLRVSLATVHVRLNDVSKALTRERLRTTILQTAEYLKSWWGIRAPRIAISGLNPHSGESGLFGDEEIRVIAPEIESLRKDRPDCRFFGPLAADTLFAENHLAKRKDRYDAVVCMYHDQGLIPVKLLDFQRTVNVTLGLPIVRTSVDHGTAFDIVGQNKADPSSLQSAIELAVKIVRNQKL